MASKGLYNIDYTTFLLKYHGVSQDINQRIKKNISPMPCSLYQVEREVSQSKRRKYLPNVLSMPRHE